MVRASVSTIAAVLNPQRFGLRIHNSPCCQQTPSPSFVFSPIIWIMAEPVYITDVSPRDGLQNEPGIVPTDGKAHLVRLLCASGVDEVEVSSFVSAKWVPQLGDASELFARLAVDGPRMRERRDGRARIMFSALAPNEQGMHSLLGVNESARARVIDKVALFTAASETFNTRNTNATIAESLVRFRPALVLAAQHSLAVRVYVSCAYACPFEGDISPGAVASVVEQVLLELAGAESRARETSSGSAMYESVEIDLGDTIGAATPSKTVALLNEVFALTSRAHTDINLVLHLHDTFGHAAESVKAALDLGVRRFDGAAGGLGGCPYASTPTRRAPGNIATETLVDVVHAAGFQTGVDIVRLRLAGEYARSLLHRSSQGATA